MRATLQLNPVKTGRHLEHLQQIKMLIGYNSVHPQVIRNLPGTDAGDFGIQSVERTWPGCSLNQGASLWNDAPAGAAPGKKTGTRPRKLQHWTFSPNYILQVHLATADTGKRPNGHRPQGSFRSENS